MRERRPRVTPATPFWKRRGPGRTPDRSSSPIMPMIRPRRCSCGSSPDRGRPGSPRWRRSVARWFDRCCRSEGRNWRDTCRIVRYLFGSIRQTKITRHQRAWLRTELLPRLRHRLPDVDAALIRSAAHARRDRRGWDALLDLLAELDVRPERDGISVAGDVLRGYDSALAESLILAAARRAGCPGRSGARRTDSQRSFPMARVVPRCRFRVAGRPSFRSGGFGWSAGLPRPALADLGIDGMQGEDGGGHGACLACRRGTRAP